MINRQYSMRLAASLIAIMLVVTDATAQGLLDRARGLFGGDADETTTEQALGEDQIGAGLKEALRFGAERVIEQLGAPGGFSADPAVHIALPNSLARVRSTLERIGMDEQLEELELRLNQAAEAAVPRARNLFVAAISAMQLEDVIEIYRGADDAATQYFRSTMAAPLAAEMRPVVAETLTDVGAAQTLENLMDRYNALPFTREVDSDLTGHVVDKGLEGVFHYLAGEEAAIRSDPLKRSSELLQRVFGN